MLPTPRYGRSAELLAILPGPVALAPGMRDALQAQIENGTWLTGGAHDLLSSRLARAIDWQEGTPLPRAALLCDDGMGMSGPSRDILASARASAHPTLFSGHLPKGSPGERLLADGLAAWIRLPTHPTLPENVAMVAQSGAATVLGHSCEEDALMRLAGHLPTLRTDLMTGDSLTL